MDEVLSSLHKIAHQTCLVMAKPVEPDIELGYWFSFNVESFDSQPVPKRLLKL